MVDIALELPAELIAAYEQHAALLGATAEELMRQVIERHAATLPPRPADAEPVDLTDEPIVKAAEIEKECQRLGAAYGWRFITCPQSRAGSAKLLLVSLNPAGRERHGPSWSQEEGSAYSVEQWGAHPPGMAPLQRQVQRMWELLGLTEEQVLSAHYVPFRSPSWADLPRQAEALSFSEELWTWLLPRTHFERVVCIGKDVPGRPIAKLLNAKNEATLPVGWGSVTANRYRLPDGRALIALPHLSRFAVFGRKESVGPLQALFSG